jgi:hypothetical protein
LQFYNPKILDTTRPLPSSLFSASTAAAHTDNIAAAPTAFSVAAAATASVAVAATDRFPDKRHRSSEAQIGAP